MKKARVEKVGGGEVVVPRCFVTESAWERMIGLLDRSSLAPGEGLWIEPSGNSIHTFFMRFPIDAVFLTRERKVLLVKANIPPWRMTGIYLRARSVLELPAGDAARLGIREGDQLRMQEMN